MRNFTYFYRYCVANGWRFGDGHHWIPNVNLTSAVMHSFPRAQWFPFRFYYPTPTISAKTEKKKRNINFPGERANCKYYLIHVSRTWLVALNSSTLFAFSNAFTSVTMTGGLMKLVSTFNTRKVLVFSIASANSNAVRSFRPTLVNDNTSKCSFSGSALNNCSNFSSEIFCAQNERRKREKNWNVFCLHRVDRELLERYLNII